jgi:two-component system, response regulator YesN
VVIRTPGRSYFIRVFLLISIAVVGIVLVTNAALYAGLRHQYERVTGQLQYNLITQARVLTDTLLRQAEMLVLALSVREDVGRFSQGGFPLTEFDRFRRATEVVHVLGTGSTGKYVQSAYLYNATSDRVLTAEGMADRIHFADATFAERAVQAQEKQRWLTSREFGESGPQVITYIGPVSLRGMATTVIVLNLNVSSLVTDFLATLDDPNSELVVLDEAGVRFAGSNLMAVLGDDVIERALSQSAHESITIGHELWSTASSVSEYTGWRYVVFSRSDHLARLSSTVVQFTIAAGIVFLLLASLLSLAVARAIYRPVRHLKESLSRIADEPAFKPSPEEEADQGEIEQIERRFLSVLRRNLEYQEQYQRNSELLKEKLLWDMVAGRVDARSIYQGLSMFSIEPTDRPVAAVLVEYPAQTRARHHIKAHFYDETVRLAKRDRDLTVIAELADTTNVVLCVGTPTDGALGDFASRLHAGLTVQFPFEFHVSVGASVTSIGEIHLSYGSAVRLLAHARLYPGVHVLVSNQGGDRRTQLDYVRCETIVQSIASALDAGRMTDVKEGIAQLLNETSSCLSHDYRQAKVTQVANLLLNHVIANLEPRFFFAEDENPWQLFARMESADDLFSWLDSVVSRVEEYYDQKQKQHRSRHVAAAVRYLNERYCEAISVQLVADSIGIAPTYLSTIFKQEVGVSFARYVLDLRLARARELLTSTDTPINVVAEESGLGSKQNIIRAFRKEYRCTPSTYRELHTVRHETVDTPRPFAKQSLERPREPR